ncbi:MAG: PGRS family protein, partial [Myxococcales bacterium]|nr:PGRS family protein [Myxococcales bacterium]
GGDGGGAGGGAGGCGGIAIGIARVGGAVVSEQDVSIQSGVGGQGGLGGKGGYEGNSNAKPQALGGGAGCNGVEGDAVDF